MIRKTLIAAALACAGFGAQAATVVVNFSSSTFDGIALGGQTLSGQFSFNDQTLTTSTLTLPLLSLTFSLGSNSFTLSQADANSTSVVFDNGVLVGINALYSGNNPPLGFSAGFGDPYAFYQVGTDFGSADLTFTPVPEPETWALMLGGLGAIGMLARRRKA